jgi:hypothetical protein
MPLAMLTISHSSYPIRDLITCSPNILARLTEILGITYGCLAARRDG